MYYKFIEDTNTENLNLPESNKINPFLLKNNSQDIVKALDFFASEGQFLYIHGFLGTGKRQFINYVSDFLTEDVIKLEYYCKQSTVCDDILLSFMDVIEKSSLSNAVIHTAKITTLAVKFQQYLSSIKKPFVIILHSFDDILKENQQLVLNCIKEALKNDNVKVVISTRAMIQDLLGDVQYERKIYLKALSKEIFREFMEFNKIKGTDDAFNDLYKYSRGYYYYLALTAKIILAMELSLNDFLAKFSMSGMSFDSFLGMTYINLIPNTIRNFFWFLRTIRHGISLNALAILELYDEFSVNYLSNNLMIYQADEIVYVQDYFQQDIDISIPAKTEKKLHKYIIGIYEKELKQPLQERAILLSRQALRAEIEYHTKKISELDNNAENVQEKQENVIEQPQKEQAQPIISEDRSDINSQIDIAKKLAAERKYTDAIECYLKINNDSDVTPNNLAEVRAALGKLYAEIEDYEKSCHYYSLAENYYKEKGEYINLNYIHYEMAEVYYKMYKTERAIETIKEVIYSVDTPQSLVIDACTLVGSMYSEEKKTEDAYKYYMKALESADENTPEEKMAELYFKLALVFDDKDDMKSAFEYYNKCISAGVNHKYKALAYSNLGACYFENYNYSDAESCFLKAYQMEKEKNNYEGIYYITSYLSKIYVANNSPKALDFLTESVQCAEFINDDFLIVEAHVALGDYYYNHKEMTTNAAIEYFKARKTAKNIVGVVESDKIEERINDMKQRISNDEFEKLEKKYE